jgi:hypothetical protein
MFVKTLNITDSVSNIETSAAYKYYWVRNLGAEDVSIFKTSADVDTNKKIILSQDEYVKIIPENNNIYFKSSSTGTKIEIYGTNTDICPFKAGKVEGSSDSGGDYDYTTAERKIGKWIDGSDLYQRTFEVTGLVNGQWNNSVLGTSGINIIEAPSGTLHWLYNNAPDITTGLNYYRSSVEFATTYISKTASDVNILPNISESGYTIDKAIITIKYTKPSA